MKLFIITCAVFLSACSNTGAVRVNPNSDTLVIKTRVSLGGRQAAMDEATKTAMEACAVEDKEPVVKQRHMNECALRGGCGEAQVYFTCQTKGNLEYQDRQPDRILEVRNR